MMFISDEHEQFYNDHRSISAGKDFEALVYTIGIADTCRTHFSCMYNVDKGTIIPDAIYKEWQTSASRAITRLAFHLFTWTIVQGDEPNNYCPRNLFYCLDDINRRGVLLALEYFA